MKKSLRFLHVWPLIVLLLISAGAKGQYFVNFEGDGEVKTAYASATVTLSGLQWDMTEALIGTLANDFRNGDRSARLRGRENSSMTMLQDKQNGAGVVSFLYRRYGTDAQVAWRVEISKNQGDTWTQIGSDFTAPASNDVQTFTATVNETGPVRIRVKLVENTGAVDRRLNIDDITITDYTGDTPTASVVTFAPGTGTYYAPVSVELNTTTEGASIHFSTTSNEGPWTAYSGAIPLSATTTLYAYASKEGLANSPVTSATYTFPAVVEVADIAALRAAGAAAKNNTVYRLTGEAVLTFQHAQRNSKYIQDATGAIKIDDQAGIITTQYNLGDGIKNITGTLTAFANMMQFVPVMNPGAPNSTGNLIAPQVVTFTSMTGAMQGQLVRVNGVSFATTGDFAHNQSYNATDASGAGVIRTPNTPASLDYFGTAIPETPKDIIGVVEQFNDAIQLIPRRLADFLTPGEAPVVTTFPWSENFNGYADQAAFVANSGWTLVDADGDGQNWYLFHDDVDNINLMASRSWLSGTGALTPDNYLITPALQLPAAKDGEKLMLTWKVAASARNAFREKYKVAVSVTGTAAADFTAVLHTETLTAANSNYNFGLRELDLSAYAGQKVHLAFVHFDCTDQDRLLINDVWVGKKEKGLFTVNFTVKDQADAAIGDAVVTFNGLARAAGQYQILYVAPGTYNYSVFKTGFKEASGSVTVTGADQTVNVVLQPEDPTEVIIAEFPWLENFENYTSNDQFFATSGWKAIDADGDGNNWFRHFDSFDGIHIMVSRSWLGGNALTPNNYLITPALQLPAAKTGGKLALTYKIAASDDEYFAEKYKVVVSTTGNNAADFTDANILFSEVITAANSDWQYGNREIDLSAYAGQKVYLAFVHFDCTDNDRLLLNDVWVGVKEADPDGLITDFPWVEEFTQAEPFPPAGWKNLDKDGDGRAFEYANPYFTNEVQAAVSWSWLPTTQQALTPDNWLITPPLKIGANFWLEVAMQPLSDSWFAEKYAILVSTTGTNYEDFTDVLFTETFPSNVLREHVLSLSAYEGKNIYIAFRHFETTDEVGLLIWDVAVYQTYSVNFTVQNQAGTPITDAVVTLGEVQGAAGNYSFAGLMPGTYAYSVAKTGFFTETGSVVVTNADKAVAVTLRIDDTSVNDPLTAGLRVYPNPASSVIYVEAAEEISRIRLLDMTGRQVMIAEPGNAQTRLDVAGLQQGLYFLELTTRSGVSTRRVQLTH